MKYYPAGIEISRIIKYDSFNVRLIETDHSYYEYYSGSVLFNSRGSVIIKHQEYRRG